METANGMAEFLGLGYDSWWLILGGLAVVAAFLAVIGIFLIQMDARTVGQATLAVERDKRDLGIVETALTILARVPQILGRSLNSQETELYERGLGFARVSLDRVVPTQQQLAAANNNQPEEVEEEEEIA